MQHVDGKENTVKNIIYVTLNGGEANVQSKSKREVESGRCQREIDCK